MQQAEKGAPPQFLSTHPSVSGTFHAWGLRNGTNLMHRAISEWRLSEDGSLTPLLLRFSFYKNQC